MVAREASGAGRDPRERRSYLLEFTAFVADGSLHARWKFSRAVHTDATMRRLADRFVERLQEMVAAPAAAEAITAASFPGARLDVAFALEEDAYSASRGYPGWAAVLKEVRPAAQAKTTNA